MKHLCILALIVLGVSAVMAQGASIERNDWGKYFEQHKVTGAFVMYDTTKATYLRYNPTRCAQGFLPASTFKIYNTLIGLDTGVITDENFTLTWDGITRSIPAWNQDHTLRSAFPNSVVWYYQVVARRVGLPRMQQYVDRMHYGNQDCSAGIDKFWLEGNMRITPDEQVELLRKLLAEELPFSPRAIGILKRVMIQEETPTYIFRAKTGTASQDGKVINWLVGYLEQGKNTYLFACNLETPVGDVALQAPSIRKAIVRDIMKEYGVLQ